MERLTLSCSPANILVGPNNAGKSSILDGMRILAGAQRYARRLKPKLIKTSGGEAWGYEIPDSSIPTNIDHAVRNYDDDDAVIDFTHVNGQKLSIRLHPSHSTQLYVEDISTRIVSGANYFSSFPIDIKVVPTLAPFEQNEPYVEDETIERSRSTRLAARYFRNIWYRNSKEQFDAFKLIVEGTWPGVTISKPTRHYTSKTLEMFYSESRRDREVCWSGFGFQVWLQIISYLLDTTKDSVFVLDEPDIYLHPDLQHKLLKLVKGRFDQFFLATHSTEIVNQSLPGDLVNIEPRSGTAKRVKTDAQYNEVFSQIGSVENVELLRISRAKKVVFFEGKDRTILQRFYNKLGISFDLLNSDALVLGVGGFGQWKRAKEAAWALRTILQLDTKFIAIFDRDYRDQRDIDEMMSSVSDENIFCLVWGRKEIENYLLNFESLKQTVWKRARQSSQGKAFSVDDAEGLIEEVQQEFRFDVQSQLTSQALQFEQRIKSGRDASSVMSEFHRKVDELWKDRNRRFEILPGKNFISRLSAKMQEDFGKIITVPMIMDELEPEQIDAELKVTLRTLSEFCAL